MLHWVLAKEADGNRHWWLGMDLSISVRLSTRKAMRTLPPFTGGNKCQVFFLNTFLLMFHRTHLRSCWKACCNMVPIQMRSASMQCLKHVVVRSSMPFWLDLFAGETKVNWTYQSIFSFFFNSPSLSVHLEEATLTSDHQKSSFLFVA